MDMLDHQKAVIEHVVNDEKLFIKELKKSLSWLGVDEIRNLYFWLIENYGSLYADRINFVFKKELSVNFNYFVQ